MNHSDLFDRLWKEYTSKNPSTGKVYDLFRAEGETVINDHIAFRTFRSPAIGVEKLATVFLKNGYEFRGDYHFETKKLYARHFEHKTDMEAPRVFISELLVDEFSPFLRKTVRTWIASNPEPMYGSDDLIYVYMLCSGSLIGMLLDPSKKVSVDKEGDRLPPEKERNLTKSGTRFIPSPNMNPSRFIG